MWKDYLLEIKWAKLIKDLLIYNENHQEMNCFTSGFLHTCVFFAAHGNSLELFHLIFLIVANVSSNV